MIPFETLEALLRAWSGVNTPALWLGE